MTTTEQSDTAPERQDEAAARERRLAALRELASERLYPGVGRAGMQPFTPAKAPPIASPVASAGVPGARARRRSAWLWSAGLAIVVIALLAGAIRFAPTLTHRFSDTANQQAVTSRTFTPQNDNLSCLIDSAWSPQGDQIALLGYQGACPEFDFFTSTSSGDINIYNVITGEKKASFVPDTLITTAEPNATAPTQQFIIYGSISWAANGQNLALPFAVVAVNQSNFSTSITQVGLLLIGLAGNQNRVFFYPYQMAVQLSTISAQVAGGFEWDTTTGKVIAHNLEKPGVVAYSWGEHGRLIGLTRAPSQAIGNPVGGQTFTIWQPGQALVGLAQPDPTHPTALTPIPNLYLWNASFGMWSPDGRYFYAPAQISDKLALPDANAPEPALLEKNGYGGLATVAPHDPIVGMFYSRALQQIPIEQQNELLTPPGADVAWSPDGRVVAVKQQLPGDTSTLFTVTLYNTATGSSIATLTHDTHLSAASEGAFAQLRWSPNGKQLALADNTFDTLTVWTFNKALV